MASKKNSFLMRLEWGTMFEAMANEDAGQLIKAIYSYHKDVDVTIENPIIRGIFEMIRESLDYSKTKYEETCKRRSENAKKRWNANAIVEMQEYANASNCIENNAIEMQMHASVGDTDTDTDTDTEYDTDTDINNIYTSSGNDDVGIDYQNIIDLYHNICFELSRVKVISETRKKAIKARLKDNDIEEVKRVFEEVAANDFLCGRNGKSWKCNFDWIMKASNFLKVQEGAYDYAKTSRATTAYSDSQF